MTYAVTSGGGVFVGLIWAKMVFWMHSVYSVDKFNVQHKQTHTQNINLKKPKTYGQVHYDLEQKIIQINKNLTFIYMAPVASHGHVF